MSPVILHFGFMERRLAKGVQDAIEHAELRCGTPKELSYFIGRGTIIPTARIPSFPLQLQPRLAAQFRPRFGDQEPASTGSNQVSGGLLT
jgi:hypothetical protein